MSAPRGSLPPSRRARQELVRKNRRLANEAIETRQRPGSNLPPITTAEVDAYWQRKREDIAAILDRAQIAPQRDRLLLQEILASRRSYQGGGNTIKTFLWAVEAMVRRVEQMDIEGTTLQELDALAHVHIGLNAINDAAAGKLAAFLDLLPKLDDPSLGSPNATTAASTRACASTGLAALTLGKAPLGGLSREKAKQEVRDAFRDEGIQFTADTLVEWAKRINRKGGDPDARAQFDELMEPVRKAAETYWPIKDRKAAMKRLAKIAGRRLETE